MKSDPARFPRGLEDQGLMTHFQGTSLVTSKAILTNLLRLYLLFFFIFFWNELGHRQINTHLPGGRIAWQAELGV